MDEIKKTGMIEAVGGERESRTNRWVLGMVYVACASLVLFCGFRIWQVYFPANRHLLQADPNAPRCPAPVIVYPKGWESLREPPKRTPFPVPDVDVEEITKTLTEAARSMEERKERSALLRRNPPLLDIYEARKQGKPPVHRSSDAELLDDPRLAPLVMDIDFLEPPTLEDPAPATGNFAQLSAPAPNSHALAETLGSRGRTYHTEKIATPEEAATSEETASSKTHSTAKYPVTFDREHGLEVIRLFNQCAKRRLHDFRNEVQDYSCILYKWDTTNTLSGKMDVMRLMIREMPFSVYSYTVHPREKRGQEWIFWDGHYDGNMVYFSGPSDFSRTLLLGLDSQGIKNSSTHSIREIGIRSLLEQLVEVSNNLENLRGADVRYFPSAQVGNRSCYALEVSFDEKVEGLTFHKIEIFVDKEWILPIRLAMYDWPKSYQTELPLLESYTYILTELNPGLQDLDFCHLNKNYGFQYFIPRLSKQEMNFMRQLSGR